MLTRSEFIQLWVNKRVDADKPSSVIWHPEIMRDTEVRCEYFICIIPLNKNWPGRSIFWDWNDKNLDGDVRCYSSSEDNQEEWWGFTNEKDIVLFMLRWIG